MELITFPNPILNQQAKEVVDFSGIAELSKQMIETAISNNLVGLAANQVGLSERIFVMDVSNEDEDKPRFIVCVNPKVKPINNYGEGFAYEGCGSLPNINCLVKRWKRVELIAQNEHGETFSMILFGFQARIAQHENDHLKGVLMRSKAREIRKTVQPVKA